MIRYCKTISSEFIGISSKLILMVKIYDKRLNSTKPLKIFAMFFVENLAVTQPFLVEHIQWCTNQYEGGLASPKFRVFVALDAESDKILLKNISKRLKKLYFTVITVHS